MRYFVVRNCPISSHHTKSLGVLPTSRTHLSNPLLPALEKKYFHIVKVLAIAGCECKALSEWLAQTPEDCWWESYIDIIYWLRDYLSQPISLAHGCRLRIRASLGHDLNRKFRTLPLPVPLLNYIAMTDLEKRIDCPPIYSAFFQSDAEIF